jgi:hypothetical protein
LAAEAAAPRPSSTSWSRSRASSPPFRDVTGVADPTTVLTFQATGEELLALVNAGMPFYKPPWSPTVVGLVIDGETDWAEVADLITESYRVCAPQKLARSLDEAAEQHDT